MKKINVYEVRTWIEIFYMNGTMMQVHPCFTFIIDEFDEKREGEQREIINYNRPRLLETELKIIKEISPKLLILPIEKIELVTCYDKIDLSLLSPETLIDMTTAFSLEHDKVLFTKYCSNGGYVK